MAFTSQVLKQKSIRLGYNLDWRYPGMLPTSEVWGVTQNLNGLMPLNLRHKPGPDGVYRSGGPWIMYKEGYTVTSAPRMDAWRRGNLYPCYSGRLGVGAPAFVDFLTLAGTSSTGIAYTDTYNDGAEHLSRLRPDLPDFTSVSSFYELRDFVPSLKGRLRGLLDRVYREQARRRRQNIRLRKPFHKRVANQVLADQFGWQPLASDIRSFAEAFNNRKKRFNQLVKDEGRPVHRETRLKTLKPSGEESRTEVWEPSRYGHSYLYPGQVTQCYKVGSGTTTVTKVEVERWAEGTCRYLLPPGPRDAKWTKNLMRKIMGGYLTAEQAYNVIPWSWLVDYFAEVGHFMSAVSVGLSDRLIWDYAYCMRHYNATRDYKFTMTCCGQANSTFFVTGSLQRFQVLKIRTQASVFGWGFTDAGLSPKQVATLGWLGMSRLN